MGRELTIPPAAEEDPSAFEILRVWGANREQHVTLFWDLWDDPATWGIMLADLANHVANALYQERGLDRAETLGKIRSMFDLELDDPTTTGLQGKVQNARRPHRRERR
jgi:Domain of unknown function (DUF5076)